MEKYTNEAFEYVNKCLRNDPTEHGLNHSKRVYNNAMTIALKHKVNIKVVALASILHDVDDPKLYEGKEPNERLNVFLNSTDINNNDKEHIRDIINTMSFSKQIEGAITKTLEGKIVQDADRLDAIGAIGIARCFAYGGYKNRLIYDNEQQNTSIQHFYDKLLKLEGLMNTKCAKRIAKKRTKFIYKFLKELNKEIKDKD